MTITEANRIHQNFYFLVAPTEEDRFLFVEALKYLIEETKDAQYLTELGGYYYGEREFDLAARYYDLASELGDDDAMCSLGYIWYYGRTGKIDYEKAFSCYDRARKAGNPIAAYKVADMYHNGYYVEKDEKKYREIIQTLFESIQNDRYTRGPIPEVLTRMARIRTEDGEIQEALRLYGIARDVLSRRIYYDPFFGNLAIMKGLIQDVYRLRPLNPEHLLFYDLYEVLKKPCRVRFSRDEEDYVVEASAEEDGSIAVQFNGKWFRSVDDFFQKAALEDEPLTHLYEEFYAFEVIS